MRKENKWVLMTVVGLFILGCGQWLYSHCQIPCGIFDDQMRIKMIAEDITTIEKSINEIVSLGKESPVNYNQLVRWIMNKEYHAEKLSETVTYYFMAQRLAVAPKTGRQEYEAKLEILHQMLVTAMKAKQSTDLANVNTLRELLKKFNEIYFAPEQK